MADSLTDPSNWRKALDAREDWILNLIRDFSIEHERSYRSPPTPQQIRAKLEEAR